MKHKVFLLTTLLMALAIPQHILAYDFSAVAPSGQTLYYDIVGDRVFVTSQNSNYPFYDDSSKPTGELIIPSSVTFGPDTYSVFGIGSFAFYECSGLTSITMPNSVTGIGDHAFYGCTGLTSTTIPNSVTGIGDYAFFNCYGLTSITIPNSVIGIGSGAFAYCSLSSVTIPGSVVYIGDGAFLTVGGLTSITVSGNNTVYDSRNNCNAIIETATNTLILGCQNTIIPQSVTSIGIFAFALCTGLTSINIPNSVTSIGERSFASSGLTSINIPNSVTSIGEAPFLGCGNLTALSVDGGNTVYDSRNNCNAIIKTSTNTLIVGCQSTTIPNSVTAIGKQAFSGSGLTSITISNNVTTIGASAFSGCDGLTSATIGKNVVSIGSGVFGGCTNLTTIYYNAANCTTGDLSNLDITELNIGNSVRVIQNNFFFGCTELTTLSIPNSVTTIGSEAFWGCRRLATISIGNAVTSIGHNAFSACDSLSHVYMQGYPPTLGSNAIPNTADIHVRCIYAQDYMDHWNSNYTYVYPTGTAPDYTIGLGVNDTVNGQAVITQAVDCDSTAIIAAVELDETMFTLFDHWNDGNTDNPRTVHLTQDTAFTAYFVPAYYCAGLWYTGQQNWGDILGDGKAKSGDTVMLTAVPNYGYHFVKWVKCQLDQYGNFSETSVTNTQNPLQQVMTNQDVFWAAEFAPDTFHVQITVNDDRWGFLNVPAEQDLAYGTELVLYAFPRNSNMCSFVEWNDGTQGELVFSGSYWGSKKTVTVTGDISLQAIFTSQYRTVTAVSSDETLGEIVSGSGDYQYLDTAVLRARPADHYHLTHWLIEYTYIDIDNGSTMTSSREVWNENPYYMPIDGNENNITATAYFAIDTHTVSVVSSNIMHGGVEGGGTFPYGTAATVTATAYSGYEFVRWSNGVTYNPYTFAVSTDVELTAVFAEQGTVHNITALAHDPTTGSVTGGGQYATGETATLTAVPAEGYRFVRWNDGNTDNPRLVLVVTDITYTAFFADINAIDDAEVASAKVYSHHGQIVVEGAEGQPVTLIDAVGRQLATKRDEYMPVRFDVPASGTYLVKIGDYAARRVVVIR